MSLMAVGVALLLCSNVSHAQDKAAPPTDAPISSSAEEANIPAVNTPPHSDENAENENPSANFGVEDLAVQKRMTDAAEKANDLTKKQNWIGWIGLILIAITAVFAWGAWRAGDQAVNVASDIGTAQTRAYVMFESVSIESLGDVIAAKRYNIIARYKVKNFGVTPAKNIRIEVAQMPFNTGNGDTHSVAIEKLQGLLATNKKGDHYNCGTLSAGGEFTSGVSTNSTIVIRMGEGAQTKITESEDRVNIMALYRLTYEDVFFPQTPIRTTETACQFVFWKDEENSPRGRSHEIESHHIST